jgi:hypothetical protein
MLRSPLMKLAPAAALLATLSLAAPFALADVAPPGLTECQGKKAGDACSVSGSSGTCIATTCSRLDYANWDRDASSSPPVVQYACTLCGTGDAGTPSADGGTVPVASDSNKGCSVGPVGRVAGSFALAAIPLAALLAFRRRRRP